MSKLPVSELIRVLETHAPSATAESWDNVGLLAGDPAWETSGAVVAIDLTAEVIAQARSQGYGLIVNHHPCIFPRQKGLSRITAGPGAGKAGLVFEAIREGIAIAACHTNFDRCALEVAAKIGAGLGLTPRGRLLEPGKNALVKLVVFVPETHLDIVRKALADAGAGQIGGYDSCSFSVSGEGRFRGSELTHPFLGKPGQIETAREARVETILPRGMESGIVRAMLQAHPYEEVAYDLYPVEPGPVRAGLVKGLGYGFWGDFPVSKPFSDFCKGVKALFKADGFLLTGAASLSSFSEVRRVAFAAGSGASVVESAAALDCDVMITGEVGYHEALGVTRYRSERPMAVVELGHRESECFFPQVVKEWLAGAGIEAETADVKTQEIWTL